MSEIFAITGVVGIILFILQKIRVPSIRENWRYPAFFASVFCLFSVYTVIQEGPLGFWTEHSRNLWSNQIWFDLLLFAAVAVYFVVPRAKKLGMFIPGWLFLVLAAGSMGMLVMLARMFYLAERAGLEADDMGIPKRGPESTPGRGQST